MVPGRDFISTTCQMDLGVADGSAKQSLSVTPTPDRPRIPPMTDGQCAGCPSQSRQCRLAPLPGLTGGGAIAPRSSPSLHSRLPIN
jgi:hypothetical protein